jgi:hypothetical protein
MGRFVDLTGVRFGRLIVVEHFGKDRFGKILYRCACDCGNEKIVLGKNLKFGTQSCGCLAKEKSREATFKDLTDKKFGKLSVIEYSGKKKDGRSIWKCLCDCGNEKYVPGSNLINGTTKSCGCLTRERASDWGKSSFIDISGEIFGKLIVIERISNNKHGQVMFKCLCDCGNYMETVGGGLITGNTRSCGCQKESYTSSELKKYFIEEYGATPEYKILKNTSTGFYLPYDIYIENKNIFIEIQGLQHYNSNHFNQTSKEFKYQQYKDKIKKIFAEENGTFIEIDLRQNKTVEEWIKYIENIIN